MGLDLKRLLDLRLFQAFDVDESGRVLAGSDDTGSTQLIEIGADGGVTALTALPGACSGRYLRGQADDQQRAVIVSHDAGGNERHQLSLLRLPLPGANPAGLDELEPLVRDPRYIHALFGVAPGRICYETNRRNGVAFDLVIRDLTNGAERALQLGDLSFHDAAMSPDGRWLAVSIASKVTANSEHVALADLTAPEGAERLIPVTEPDAAAMNLLLAWTPDSAALVWSSNNDREFIAVTRYDLASGERATLIADDGADVVGWLSPDGTTILAERNVDGASVLSLHGAAGELIRDVPLPAAGCVRETRLPSPTWSADSGAVVLSVSSPELPGDAVLIDVATGTGPGIRPLTNSARGLNGDKLAAPELHRVPSPAGDAIPCMVYRPLDGGDPALAGSAVLLVHGGPEAQARQNYNANVQALAAAGHTVLVPNVRGSAGYGKRWYSADDVRLRMNSVDDMAALHAYLPALGLDQERAALWGGSYGGYMVLAGLAFQPSLWAAGVDIVGIASLVTFLENTSAYRRAYREREYGSLTREREFLHEISPLTRVDDITAPLFIIHGANDPRVPLSEAEQIHAAMTARGRECELLVFGDEGHGLAKRGNRADAVPKAVEFLARHLNR
jgi:dipeptidyl aminopeptidase/acylaminoacyl peptidase